MKKRCMPAAALLRLSSHSAFATELDPIIVTATRTAQTADETLASVTVITRNDIERQQARAENLFDKDYETAAFFNQPGRSLFVTLRYQS